MSELSDRVAAVLALDPAAPAIEFERGWLSWGDLSAMAAELRELLAPLGPPTGLRVGALLANRPYAVGAILDAVLDGHCLVTFSAAYPDERVVEDLSESAVPALICAERDARRAGLQETVRIQGIHLIVAEEGPAGRVHFRVEYAGSTRSHNPGIGVEMMTSGTTGRPKRIPIPAANISRGVLGQTLYESGPPGPRLRGGASVLTTSFAHIGGLSALLYAIASGRKACVLERTTIDSVLSAIRRHRPRVVRIPPAIVRQLLDSGVSQEDLSSLMALRTGTAPLDPALVDAFLEKFGLPVLQNYGATEFGGGAAGWSLADFKTYWPAKRGSVGRLSSGVEGRIVDPETGATLPPGTDGALEVKSARIGDGVSWLRTTDLAALDEDGFLFLKGRLDDIINRGGFKVVPDAVRAVLESHPDVREACVVGVPDARLGQVPAAAIALRDARREPAEADLSSHVKASLAPYAAPVRYVFVAGLPRTPSMKVDNAAVRAILTATPQR